VDGLTWVDECYCTRVDEYYCASLSAIDERIRRADRHSPLCLSWRTCCSSSSTGSTSPHRPFTTSRDRPSAMCLHCFACLPLQAIVARAVSDLGNRALPSTGRPPAQPNQAPGRCGVQARGRIGDPRRQGQGPGAMP
jgi:hypothetical protein